jgi:hypothetical protein
VEMGMQFKRTPAAAQYTTWWAHKFALMLIFLASHLEEGERRANVSIDLAGLWSCLGSHVDQF